MTGDSVNLVYADYLPDTYFEEFSRALTDAGLSLQTESYPSRVQAGLEFYLPAAICIYVAKIFLDDLLKRAAKDTNDVVYPKLKEAIVALAKRVFVSRREIVVVATPGKVTYPEALMFAFHTETADGRKLKCLFLSTLPESEYDLAVERLFALLRDHYEGQPSEKLLETARPRSSWKPVILAYDHGTGAWTLRD